jgi:metallo-beta-lactamase family protein
MGIEATEIYSRHTEEHDFEMARLRDRERCPISSRNMIIHRTPEQSKSINALKGPMIIISASGMATGGRVLHHLKHRLPNPDTTVLLAGYQAEGTRGRLLQDGAKEIKMLGETIPVRAKVKLLDGFSAHADQGEIMRWLGTFQKAPTMTYIVHGEAKAASALRDLIRERLKWKVEIARYQQKVKLG